MRTLVCGGRDFLDIQYVHDCLSELQQESPITVIITGSADGVDEFANIWANNNGIELIEFPAQWKLYGRLAGPIRNQHMIDFGHPDRVLTFPGGRGTSDMIRRAEASGIPIHRRLYDDDRN